MFAELGFVESEQSRSRFITLHHVREKGKCETNK